MSEESQEFDREFMKDIEEKRERREEENDE